MSNTEKKTFLLVSFPKFSENMKQDVLETAMEFLAFPYLSNDDPNSFVFEFQSPESQARFKEKLEKFKMPITISSFSR